jgi:hypothetical protein
MPFAGVGIPTNGDIPWVPFRIDIDIAPRKEGWSPATLGGIPVNEAWGEDGTR